MQLQKVKGIDGLHLTSEQPCWRYNTKEYVINSIVESRRRGWLTLSATSREFDCKLRIWCHFYKIISISRKLKMNSSVCYAHAKVIKNSVANTLNHAVWFINKCHLFHSSTSELREITIM